MQYVASFREHSMGYRSRLAIAVKYWLDTALCLFIVIMSSVSNSQAATQPVAEILGAPAGYSSVPYPSITISGDGIISYLYKVDNGDYSAELPVATPVNLDDSVVIDNQTYQVGTDQLNNYINSRVSPIGNIGFTGINSDVDILYLLNPKRFYLSTENILSIEGDAGVNGLSVDLNDAPAGSLGALQSFSISGGRLTQPDGTADSFILDIPPGLDSVVVTPNAYDAGSTILVNGFSVASGTATDPIPVFDGSQILLEVITPDGTRQTYAITTAVNQALNVNTTYRSFYLRTETPNTDYIHLGNNSKSAVTFKMNLNNKTLGSNDDLLGEIRDMPPDYAGEPLYRKAWRFVRDNRYHLESLSDGGWYQNPALFFNSVGFGLCGDSAHLLSKIWSALGYQARVWYMAGHVVPELYSDIDGKWEIYDPDLEVYYTARDGTVAGMADLASDPGLITNPLNPVSSWILPYAGTIASTAVYGDPNKGYVVDSQMPAYALQLQLPPNGTLDFPSIFSPQLKGSYDFSFSPKYTNARLRVPNGWSGNLGIPLVVQSIDLAPGHTLSVLGKDGLGNWQTEPTVSTWTYDITPPVVTAFQASGVYSPTEPVTLVANEPATIYYTTDGSIPTTGSSVYTGPVSSVTPIRYLAVDAAGNTGEIGSYPDLTVQVVSDRTSPQLTGSTVGFTAQVTFTGKSTGSPGIYEYSFWLYDPAQGSWKCVQGYSSNSHWGWDTSQYPPGTYSVQVWARVVGSSAQYDTYYTLDYTLVPVSPATGISLTADKLPPQTQGVHVTFTASASGGTGVYEYAFWLYDPLSGTWVPVQSYGSNAQWDWDTTGYAPGDYFVMVWARSVGSTAPYDVCRSLNSFTISVPPAGGVTLTTDYASPQIQGSQVMFTGQATGATGSYEYEFWLQGTDGSWTTVQGYSGNPSWSWSTAGYAPGSYNVQVWARSVGSTAQYDAYKGTSFVIGIPRVALAADKVSPQVQGSIVAFTGQVPGGSGSYEYEFWLRSPDGSWTVVQGYSSSSSWSWSTADYAPGSYNVQVWARRVGSTARYDAYKGTGYLIAVPPAAAVTLSTDKVSPQVQGSQVTFTGQATGGTGSYEYEFWLQGPDGSWTTVQGYSGNPSWSWSTAGYAPGRYNVQVWARSVGSTAQHDVYKGTNYLLAVPPAAAVTLSTDKVSPQGQGSQVTFTGQATGGTGSYEYEFWLQGPDGSWTSAQGYSGNPSWTWSTAGYAPGRYNIQVWARSIGSTAQHDVYKGTSFVIEIPRVVLAADKVSPQVQGSQVTFTGQATGGTGSYEYEFWLQGPDGSWTTVQGYSGNPSWSWSTAGYAPGSYNVQVWARNVGSTAQYDAFNSTGYLLVVPPAAAVTLSTDKVSPQVQGSPVTFTGQATGGTGSYEYEFWLQGTDGSWTSVQGYSGNPSWSWSTAGYAPGSYNVQVWARSVGSTAQCDAFNSASFVIEIP